MDKEKIKQIINDFIDSIDEIREFTLSNEVEEIDMSTLDAEYKEYRLTGIKNLYITAFKKVD